MVYFKHLLYTQCSVSNIYCILITVYSMFCLAFNVYSLLYTQCSISNIYCILITSLLRTLVYSMFCYKHLLYIHCCSLRNTCILNVLSQTFIVYSLRGCSNIAQSYFRPCLTPPPSKKIALLRS